MVQHLLCSSLPTGTFVCVPLSFPNDLIKWVLLPPLCVWGNGASKSGNHLSPECSFPKALIEWFLLFIYTTFYLHIRCFVLRLSPNLAVTVIVKTDMDIQYANFLKLWGQTWGWCVIWKFCFSFEERNTMRLSKMLLVSFVLPQGRGKENPVVCNNVDKPEGYGK